MVKKIAGSEHAKLLDRVEISGFDMLLDKLSYKAGILTPYAYSTRLDELETALHRILKQCEIMYGIPNKLPVNTTPIVGKKMSVKTIDFIADAMSGGPGGGFGKGSPWPYRTGPQLEKFFRGCNYDFSLGASSRVPWAESCLNNINNTEGVDGIKKIVEHLLDPQDWFDKPQLLDQLVEELNKRLSYDELEVIQDTAQRRHILRERNAASSVVDDVRKTHFFSVHSIEIETRRMLESVDSDPPDAITAASSLVETVAKQLLTQMNLPYPSEQVVSTLVNEVRKGLKLMPDDVEEAQFKAMIRSLTATVHALGEIRTKFGDAHGHAVNTVQVKPRHARLAVNAAATISRFLVETYEENIATQNKNDMAGMKSEKIDW